MEYLDMYDENCKWLGFSRPRSADYRPGEYHLIVHVCLLNERGEMLIQQRASTISYCAGMWDLTIGGHVLAGEKPEEAAVREVREELGLDIVLSEARVRVQRYEHSFNYVYAASIRDVPACRGDADKLICMVRLQMGEVQAARWALRSEIRRMMEEGSFLVYPKELMDWVYSG